ncbi:SANT and BTB domain regulator of class switch recombination-like [Physella acuta]|uniref:SANT and BTB domain regulator of class switch recombination-like n=1 Tax=Physella acuta TaxID=109671 RepID=UPI0027DDA2B6|nr:SANT and BTB domain regulator of class switch recombination-like [Physella acuta]
MSVSKGESSVRVGVTLDLILKTLIASSDFTSLDCKNWEAISNFIPGTTAIQCARRYEELLSSGGGIAFQHLTNTLSTSGLRNSTSVASLTDSESSGRITTISRPNSSKTKGTREDKDKASASKDGQARKDLGHKGPIMVIHVCDEGKNLKKDFQCPRDLLVQEMKYFAEYLSTDAQRWEEVDISVHCDVQIFDWLIKYVKRGTKEVTEEPKLEANNVVSILISSDFLKMDNLVQECVEFCHKNMSAIVATPCNMGCINDRLLTRIAELFTHNEADEVKDRKDKFKSKLFSKKIEKLFEPGTKNGDSPELASTLFKCSVCKRLLTKTLKSKVKCMPSRMTIDRSGQMTFSHIPDLAFDVNDHILELKTELKSWRDVYWRLWGTVNSLTCGRCEQVFPLTEFGHCSYHPEAPVYDNEPGAVSSCVGMYPCCQETSVRFDPTQINKGCKVKDHVVNLPALAEGDKATKSQSQILLNDLLARRDVICVPHHRPLEPSDMVIDVFGNELFACQTRTSGVQLPSLSAVGSDESRVEVKPRLQPLTIEKEVSFFIDSFGSESDDELGDDESQKDRSNSALTSRREKKGLKKSLVTVEPQAILLDAPEFDQMKKLTWDTQRSIRYNQDAQRQEDARRMKEIRLFLTRLRLTPEKVDRPKKEYLGGIFSKLEAQWRVNNVQTIVKQTLPGQFRARPKPLGAPKQVTT